MKINAASVQKNKALKIGDVSIETPLFLGPMAGYTNLPFRLIAKEFGIVCMVRAEDDVKQIIAANDFLRNIEPYIEIVDTPKTWRSISSSEVRRLYEEKQYAKIDAMIPVELNGLRKY